MANEVSVSRAIRDVAPGSRVLATPCCGTPETLLLELGRHAERTDGLVLTTGLTFGSFPHQAAVRAGRLRYRTWHPSGAGLDLVRDGLASYLPLRASDVRVAITGNTDVLLIRISPPDRDGWCSTGPTASITRAAIETARLVIAEVDPDLPRTTGDSRVHVSEITHLVASDDPTPYYPENPDNPTNPDNHTNPTNSSNPDPRTEAIATRVAGLIPRGATVQLGLGPVTEAVGELLGRHDDPFGIRVLGVITERMIPLAEASSGTVRAVELVGGPKLMAWANRNSRVEMASSDRIHDPVFLGRTERFVSVISAASVDLAGQAVCDGIGGSADFFEGAHLSSGGLRILALASTDARGRPAIVSSHPEGAQVTVPGHSVDVVVTEHGVAWLRGRTLSERREALLAVSGGLAASEGLTESGEPAANGGLDTSGGLAASGGGER
ncbi:MAG: hypothetical protein J2P25_22830 [Nocardiopsaceae bacterium]|nr:hypothetical protein [Nocardiopsaceae bacterium]